MNGVNTRGHKTSYVEKAYTSFWLTSILFFHHNVSDSDDSDIGSINNYIDRIKILDAIRLFLNFRLFPLWIFLSQVKGIIISWIITE